MSTLTVGFAGMTHLGLNSAVAAAARDCQVIAYDPDGAHIARLAAGKPHVLEPNLEALMAEHRPRMTYTSDVAALAACDVVYVAPDVPTDDMGSSDLSGLCALIEAVDAALPLSVVLVLLSQVPPGFCRSRVLKPGRIFHYQVETLIFGQAVERALHPERIILGCAEPKAPLPEALVAFLERFQCPRLPMRYESAELAKISINCCLVASVTVANTLAELCEQTGADWSEIVPALKLDRRIGAYSYLAPGLGIAGGNLERDLNTVVRLADQHGTDAGMVRAWIHNSRYRKNWVLRALHEHVFPHVPSPRIALWGLAYKQDTASTKNAASLELVRQLKGQTIRAFDPAVQVAGLEDVCLEQAASALDACEGADVLAIMTPWSEFARVSPAEIRARMKGHLVIDPYRVLAAHPDGLEGLTYLTLGTPLQA